MVTPDLATSLNVMGFLLQAQGAYGEAQRYLQRALAMRGPLPQGRYPQGTPTWPEPEQPGRLLQDQGAYGEARGYYERALAMYQALYPKERYPQGHPALASSLNNLGCLLQDQGAHGEARGYLERRWRCTRPSTPRSGIRRGTPTWP